MNNLSISQQYYIITIDKNGIIPVYKEHDCKAGLVSACILDLLIGNCVEISGKKLSISGELSDDLKYLSTFYGYLKKKPRTSKKIAEDYGFALTDGKVDRLADNIARSIIKEGLQMASTDKHFVPADEVKAKMIDSIKKELDVDSRIQDKTIALLCLLSGSLYMNLYFTDKEKKIVRAFTEKNINDPIMKMIKIMTQFIGKKMETIALIKEASFSMKW